MASLLLAAEKKLVLIYKGEGVYDKYAAFLHRSLNQMIDKYRKEVKFISPEQIVEGSWQSSAALLVIGGGYDLGVIKALGNTGQEVIQQFVFKGGSYLGICSGSYFGSSYIEFDKDGPLEVIGERHLKFYPGGCIGPQFADYHYNTEKGSRASLIDYHFSNSEEKTTSEFHIFFKGGGAFFPLTWNKAVNGTILPKAGNEQKKVRLESQDGKHIESGIQQTASQEVKDGEIGTCVPKSCTGNHGNSVPQTERVQEKFVLPTLHNKFSRLNHEVSDVQVLSRYLEMPGQHPAIVKTRVGKGVAILSGVHFEFTQHDLDPDDVYHQSIRQKIVDSDSIRQRLFVDILKHLGCFCTV